MALEDELTVSQQDQLTSKKKAVTTKRFLCIRLMLNQQLTMCVGLTNDLIGTNAGVKID